MAKPIGGGLPWKASPTITPGASDQDLFGQYNHGTVQGDPDLVAGNIKSGINLFGVAGSASPSAGTTSTAEDDKSLSNEPLLGGKGDGAGTLVSRLYTPSANAAVVCVGFFCAFENVAALTFKLQCRKGTTVLYEITVGASALARLVYSYIDTNPTNTTYNIYWTRGSWEQGAGGITVAEVLF